MDRVTLERYTIPDIAAALNVRPNTVSSYRSRGQMPAPTGYVGRTPWWSPVDIEPWIKQQRANRRHIGRGDGDNTEPECTCATTPLKPCPRHPPWNLGCYVTPLGS